MFQPAATAIVWGIYLAVRGAEATGEGNRAIAARLLCWLGMVLALTYALYSYLFAAFALPGLGLSLLLLCRQQGRLHWRRLGEGVLALGITAALFLPLASNAWLVNSDQSPPGQLFGEFLPYLWRQLRTFTIWQAAWPELLAGAALLLFALLALLGYVLPGTDGRQARTRLLLLLWTAPPLLIAGVLQATNANVLKEDRYFLYLAPFVLWAVARGAVLLGRWRRLLPTAAGGLAVILLLAALPTLWTPRLLRENWRGTAAYIAAYQEASPALPAAGVIHADYLYGSLDWYLGQSFTFTDLPVYQVFNGPISDADMAVIAPRLAGIEASGAETLWLVQSHLEGIDDERRLQHWLDERYPVATEQFPAGIELTGYALRTVYTALPALAGPATYPGAELAPGLVLAACEITTPVIHRAAESLTDAGGRVHVRLWWQATEALAEDYRSNIQVTGAAGVWGRELPQANGTLRHYPTSAWPVGAYIRHEVDILLNPATPTGQSYTVLAGLQGADGAPLKQTVACGEVGVGE